MWRWTSMFSAVIWDRLHLRQQHRTTEGESLCSFFMKYCLLSSPEVALFDYLIIFFFFFFRELFHYVDVCNIQIARYNLLGKKNTKSALLKSITFSLFMAQSRKTINIRTPVQILILRVADHIYSLGWEIKRASCLRILILSRQEIPCRKSNIWECSLHFHKQK